MKNQMLQEILLSNEKAAILAVFHFNSTNSDEEILLKFNCWVRYFFPKFFSIEDAPFHRDIDRFNLDVYRGKLKSFTNIVFRGGAKTTRTKLFIGYVVANDDDHYRKYFKVLTKDLTNAKQSVTDVYNMFVDEGVHSFYPEIFAKTKAKREETMGSFTTSTGIKVIADTVGTDQRGQLQDSSRPDFIWFDDFETRKTLYSAVETFKIWDNMEEARTGLSKDGGSVYTCNYISERGNVHRLIAKQNTDNKVLFVPIMNKAGVPSWDLYTPADITKIKHEAEDFGGEYMCEPSASLDVIFDRTSLDNMVIKAPVKEVAGLTIYHEYDPSHRYASGHDVAGGVGLDSSTSVIIDFSTIPANVVATYHNNEMRPDVFGDEIARQGEKFGECLVAVENNKFDMVILRLRQIYPVDKIYKTSKESVRVIAGKQNEYGWNTNTLTKPKMVYALAKAIEDGLISLNDPALIQEAKSYSRDDIMDKMNIDARLTTRHFDLLTAAAIAWQMKDEAPYPKQQIKEAIRIRDNRETRQKSGGDFGL